MHSTYLPADGRQRALFGTICQASVLRRLQAGDSTRPAWDGGRHAEMRALLGKITAKLKTA